MLCGNLISDCVLTFQDCLFLGKHCFNSGALSRSLEWFEEAWVMAGVEGNRTLRQDQVNYNYKQYRGIRML